MYFYEVLLSSNKFHGQSSLTYSNLDNLKIGQIVSVPLGNNTSLGIIIKKVVKPKYKVKSISLSFPDLILPGSCIITIKWIANYYPSPFYSIVSAFLPNKLSLKMLDKIDDSNSNELKIIDKLPKLTDNQSLVVNKITNDKINKSFFIHGDTGTGKTFIYIEIILNTLKNNRSCLVLTPEISLTPQLYKEFKKYIDFPIYVIHSNLTELKKRQLWLKLLKEKKPVVIVGPRSVLFTPISNIGLIVIDECHESTYKQEQFPKYNAIYLAAFLSNIHNCKLVLGTATPSISDIFYFDSKKLPIFRLKEKAIPTENKVHISLINIKDRTNFTKHSFISNILIDEIKLNLKNNKQSLIFLNKRGTARLISCNKCGWVDICPNCRIPLTLHLDNQKVRCHTCGFSKKLTINCPNCKSNDISFKNIGSKALFENIKYLFPNAKVQRFDSDSSTSEKLENNYEKVKSGDIDILVGTQILAKGLDLPKLGLIGIISADSNLSFPDYKSEENNYQLLTQIIGRVGRGHTEGKVIIQTLNPESTSLKAAVNGNWEEFFKEQIIQRKEFNLPPFSFILKIIIQRKTMKSINSVSKNIIKIIQELGINVQISGPSPRFHERAMGNYNWQLIIKSKKRNNLLKIIENLPSNVNYDIDPINLL